MGNLLSVPSDLLVLGLGFFSWRETLKFASIGKFAKERVEFALVQSARRERFHCSADISGFVVTMRRLGVYKLQVDIYLFYFLEQIFRRFAPIYRSIVLTG